MNRIFLLGLLATTIAAAPAATPLLAPLAGVGETPGAPWHVAGLPGQTKPYTRFTMVSVEGKRVLRIEADASYGHLVHPLPEGTKARMLSWRWRLDEPNPRADLQRKEGDDSPAKICALFDLPMNAVPFVERQVLRMARLRSPDPMPAATVCYVWDARLAPGTQIDNAFTRRIRFIVLRGPEAPLHSWINEQRDVEADFMRLFRDEAETVSPLVAVSISADADNTKSRSVAHVESIDLH